MLAYELSTRGMRVETQVPFPVVYKEVKLDAGLRIDLLIEEQLIVEVKSVETMHPVFEAQILTYLKLTGRRCVFVVLSFHLEHIPPKRSASRQRSDSV